MAEKKVKIFTISTCIHCKALKRMLDEQGIVYDFEDVDLMPEKERESFIEATREYNEKNAYPIVMIGNKAIVGYQEKLIRSELGIGK